MCDTPKTRTKDYIVYEYDDNVDIIVGRNQHGNQVILDEYMKQNSIDQCTWFHLANPLTSAHVILYEKNKAMYSSQDLIPIYLWIRKQVYKGSEHVIFCPLKNIKTTSIEGKVIYKDEAYVTQIANSK